MYYRYETDAATFIIRRQRFTEGSWELLIDDRFVDSYPSPLRAVLALPHTQFARDIDPLHMPPPRLDGWEVRWNDRSAVDAPELWLHNLYLNGRP